MRQAVAPEPSMEPRSFYEPAELTCFCNVRRTAVCSCEAGLCVECGKRCENCGRLHCAACLGKFEDMKLCGSCLRVAVADELAAQEMATC